MPAASEVKKIDQSWESKVTDISTGNLWGDLAQINRAILDCNEAVTDAGLGGISYVSQNSEIQRRMNAIGIMEEYVMGIRSALQQQLDDPLFDGFNKKATETLSRIHPEKFETANTLGLTVTLGASGHGESYSSKQTKDHLDLYDFLGYTMGNYSEYGCLHTESMECVQDFADMFKADYDAVSKSGVLKGSSVKSLDDYLKNLVSGGDFSHHMDQPFKSFLSGLLDITIVKPIIDACTGYDCVTGEDLSNTEQSLDLLFAAVSLIPFAGVAGKAIEIGGKEGALFLGKRVAVDCVSYAASYSAGKLAEQKGLDPRANILISLGIGITVTKVAGKYILKDAVLNNYKTVKEYTAEEANQWFKDNIRLDYKPPYKPGTIVNEIELTKNTTFVRVYDNMPGGSVKYGSWLMKEEDIKGLTAKQIQEKFVLPSTPKYICDVEIEKGTHLRVGDVNPIDGWGHGGGTQYDLIGQRVGNFTNERLIK